MDRRTIWAILLMMVIAIVPAVFIKRSPPRAVPATRDTTARAAPVPAAPAPSTAPADTLRSAGDTGSTAPAVSTVAVTAPLYTYGVSTQGGRLVSARLARYRSMAPEDSGGNAQILPKDSRLLGLTLVTGHDTIPLESLAFTPSTDSLDAAQGIPLRLTTARGPVQVQLDYRFAPDDYRIDVHGHVTGIGPNGGTLLVGMGPTLTNTEANLVENHRALAVVTRRNDAERTDLGASPPGSPRP